MAGMTPPRVPGKPVPLFTDGELLRLERSCAGRVFPHRFRHHFSHAWLDHGGAEGDLMELNGWTSPQMLRRYGASAASARTRRSYDRVMDDAPLPESAEGRRPSIPPRRNNRLSACASRSHGRRGHAEWADLEAFWTRDDRVQAVKPAGCGRDPCGRWPRPARLPWRDAEVVQVGVQARLGGHLKELGFRHPVRVTHPASDGNLAIRAAISRRTPGLYMWASASLATAGEFGVTNDGQRGFHRTHRPVQG